MNNILVTGGAGFIGSNFTHYILKREKDALIVNLDLLTYAANLKNLRGLPDQKRYTFIQGDICDHELVDRILREYAINKVVHFAAETHVDRSIRSPAKFIETNITGTFILLDAVKKAWLEDKIVPLDQAHFHHISTDEVFGSLGPNEPDFTENQPYNPNSPYAASKAASDHLVRAYNRTYGLPVTISNCSNNYGPFQFPEKLIPLIILNATNGRELPVYGDGMQVRDWLYVEDHCEAIWLIVCSSKHGETFNIGGNNQFTNIQLVREICQILDEKVPNSGCRPHSKLIRFVADRLGHDRRYSMSIEKIRRELGWQPSIELRAGLEKTVCWYLNNPEWLNGINERQEYITWVKNNYLDREKRK